MQAEGGDLGQQCDDRDGVSLDNDGWDVRRGHLDDDIYGLKHRVQLISQLYGQSYASLKELSLSCETITNLLPERNITRLADDKYISYQTIGNSDDWYGYYLPELRKAVAEEYSLVELYDELYNVVKGGDEDRAGDTDTDDDDNDVITKSAAQYDDRKADFKCSAECDNFESLNKDDINVRISQGICEEQVEHFGQDEDDEQLINDIEFRNNNDIISMECDEEGGNIMGEGGGNDCLEDGENSLNYIDRFIDLDAGLLPCALAKVGNQSNLGLLFDSLRNSKEYWECRTDANEYTTATATATATANTQADGLTSVESHPIQEHMEYGKHCTRQLYCDKNDYSNIHRKRYRDDDGAFIITLANLQFNPIIKDTLFTHSQEVTKLLIDAGLATDLKNIDLEGTPSAKHRKKFGIIYALYEHGKLVKIGITTDVAERKKMYRKDYEKCRTEIDFDRDCKLIELVAFDYIPLDVEQKLTAVLCRFLDSMARVRLTVND